MKVKDANGCLSSSATIAIGTNAALTFTTTVVNPSPCLTGTNGRITVAASGGAGYFNYSKNGGTTWQASNIFNSMVHGTYPIKVKDILGCLSNVVNVNVGSSCREGEIVSLASSEDFNVYPNPTNDEVTIAFSSDKEEEYSICLVDVTGRVIRCTKNTTVIGDNQYQMNILEVAKGLYFIILQKGDATLQKKIIVQ